MANSESEILNKELYDLYKGQWAQLEKIYKASSQLSYPQLVWVPEDYIKAKFKLMIVGQQPNRWGFDTTKGKRQDFASIRALITEGKDFMSSPKDKNRFFWIASYYLYQLLNPDSLKYCFVWSNLIKIDDKNDKENKTARVKPEVEQEICGLRLLQEEIKITQPNVVVFFTGPDYDDRLRKEFKGIEFEDVESYKKSELARLKHELLLPPNSFRTHHPDYLRWESEWRGPIKKIAGLVTRPT